MDPDYPKEFAGFRTYRCLLREKHLARLSKENRKAAWTNIDSYFETILFRQLEAKELESRIIADSALE